MHPDNFIREAPCRFEADRYGGEALLEPSLDFFAVSSARSLELLRGCASDPSRRLHAGLHLILRYSLGFARDFEGSLALLRRFPVVAREKVPPAVLSKASRIYEQQKEGFLSLMRRELEALTGGLALHDDVRAARGDDLLAAGAVHGSFPEAAGGDAGPLRELLPLVLRRS